MMMKLCVLWYILRGYGVIYRAYIHGDTVIGNRRLLIHEATIYAPDGQPIYVSARPNAHLV